MVTKCDHLQNLRFSRTLPYAFTEHGAIMAANVLNTAQAVEMGVFIVRAFVRLMKLLVSHAELARKVTALEEEYDKKFTAVFDAVRELMSPEPIPTKREIGYHAAKKKG